MFPVCHFINSSTVTFSGLVSMWICWAFQRYRGRSRITGSWGTNIIKVGRCYQIALSLHFQQQCVWFLLFCIFSHSWHCQAFKICWSDGLKRYLIVLIYNSLITYEVMCLVLVFLMGFHHLFLFFFFFLSLYYLTLDFAHFFVVDCFFLVEY